MYSVTIRDHFMIAHSFKDPAFGPAQKLHGATYITDVTFSSATLGPQNVVMDIGKAVQLLKEVLAPYQYQNLDELEEFRGKLTTTEFMAKHIHDALATRTRNFFSGKIRVTLGESHVAWASYED